MFCKIIGPVSLWKENRPHHTDSRMRNVLSLSPCSDNDVDFSVGLRVVLVPRLVLLTRVDKLASI